MELLELELHDLSLLGLTFFLTLITMHGHWKRKLGSRSEPTHRRICDKVSMVAPPSWPGENPITLKLSGTESTVGRLPEVNKIKYKTNFFGVTASFLS